MGTDNQTPRRAALTGRSDPIPAVYETIAGLYNQGFKVTEIARLYGLHPQQISRVLANNGHFSPAVVRMVTGYEYEAVRVMYLVPLGYDPSQVPSYIMGFAPRQCPRTSTWFLPIVPWQRYAPESMELEGENETLLSEWLQRPDAADTDR